MTIDKMNMNAYNAKGLCYHVFDAFLSLFYMSEEVEKTKKKALRGEKELLLALGYMRTSTSS